MNEFILYFSQLTLSLL